VQVWQPRSSNAAKSWRQVTLFAFLSSMMFDGRRDVPKDVKRA
jgi:hypothetical protein